MNKILIVILAIALGGGVYWYAYEYSALGSQEYVTLPAMLVADEKQSPPVLPTQEMQKIELGWGSFEIPRDWKAEIGRGDEYVAYSPDYLAADLSDTYLGHDRNSIAQGMMIRVSREGFELNPRIQESEAYVVFNENTRADCTNCVGGRRTMLDGQVAYYGKSTYEDAGGTMAVGTVVNKRGVVINISVASFTPEIQALAEQIFASVDLR